MTIFECPKDKNMTRVKNKVINVKVVLILSHQMAKNWFEDFNTGRELCDRRK
jgi:hypothetical protein